jgi:hypothetical protein
MIHTQTSLFKKACTDVRMFPSQWQRQFLVLYATCAKSLTAVITPKTFARSAQTATHNGEPS